MKKNAVGFFFCYWLVLFLFSCPGAMARQPATVITNRDELTNIAHHIFYLEDSTGAKSFEQISSSTEADLFQPFNKPFVNFGLSPSAFWMRLELQNRTGEKLLLQIGNTAISDIKVYEWQAGKPVSVIHSGSWQNFSQRPLQNSDYIFPLGVANGQSTTIYIRVQHYRGTQFPLTVGTLQAYYHESNNRNLLEGIYYGFMLLMILYNLFIYFSLRDVSYLYYVAYIFFMALLNASINGYAFKYFWPSSPWLNQYEDIISSLVGITGILFASTFLNTKKHTPLYHRFFLILLAAYAVIIGLILTKNFFWGSIAVNIISLLLVLSFFGAAWQTLHKNYRPAKFFLIAWSLLLLSVIVFILKDFDILPYNAITVNSLQIGSAIEALLLSMALANRINIYKKEKQQAQLQVLRSLEANEKLITEQKVVLENTVQERTNQLQSTNKELLAAMENLQATQAQLVQKEKMASLGELTAGIAHEIQNPLNFVNNFAEVSNELVDEMTEELANGNNAEVQVLAADIKKNLEKISHHGRRADGIVKNMLQHSRTGNSIKEPTDINGLADEFLHLSYHGLRAKDKSFNAGFKTNFDDRIGKVPVLPQDLGRVLLNLFNNAFYAVNDKKKVLNGDFVPMVNVRTQKLENIIQIEVTDNGNGVPQKAVDKIFQPFFTTKPTGEGTGLGLSLSYEIITKGHGGEMKVESKEGEYATFIIQLPITKT